MHSLQRTKAIQLRSVYMHIFGVMWYILYCINDIPVPYHRDFEHNKCANFIYSINLLSMLWWMDLAAAANIAVHQVFCITADDQPRRITARHNAHSVFCNFTRKNLCEYH